MGQHASAQDVAADHRHQHRVLEIVVERVASGDALDGAPGERTETLGHFVMGRAENVPEIVGKKLPQLLGRRGRDRVHRARLPNEGGRDSLTMDIPVPVVNLVQSKPGRQSGRSFLLLPATTRRLPAAAERLFSVTMVLEA